MASSTFKRLVRFVPTSDSSKILIGQPIDDSIDVGAALRKGQKVEVDVFSGSSVLSPGQRSTSRDTIQKLLSPLAAEEVGTIRGIGLNYKQHAEEVQLQIPTVPTVFMYIQNALKPCTAIGDPWPTPTMLPKITQIDDCGDYEAELAVVIGKTAKNVSKDDAMNYVLGYTACNDVSSRTSQFAQSQWSFSKSFDGSCPLGPTLVSPSVISDPCTLRLRGVKNQELLQDCGIDDLIFSVAELISFLSQGTTLPVGTVIITGTPAGVGVSRNPKVTLAHGDEFWVEILPHIGTLVNVFQNEM